MNPTIISCALTGGADTADKNPAAPGTPDELIASALDARREGAAIVHIHVRDPETRQGSMRFDLYQSVVEGLRASGTDLILNLTTGPGGRFVPGRGPEPADGREASNLASPEDRIRHVLQLKPEICTLDMGTLNFRDHVLTNTESHLRQMAASVRDAGILPELEIFDSGQLQLARAFMDEGLLRAPGLFQLCLGLHWGAPATPAMMLALTQMLPDGAIWAAFGPGRHAFPMVAQAFLLGGHVRVGLEDNLYFGPGELASGNGQLVARAANIVELLGGKVASPDEARSLLRIVCS